MTEIELPAGLAEARRTPLFDRRSLPGALERNHRTTVWATLHVQEGSVRYVDTEGDAPRDERLDAGESIAIPPDLTHAVEPSTGARFFVQFYRDPDAGDGPGAGARATERAVPRCALGAPRPTC